jgi:hypothetical protein
VLAEIVVLDVVRLDVPLVGRRDQDHAPADAAEQRLTPCHGGRDVDGPAHARQRRDQGPGPVRAG